MTTTLRQQVETEATAWAEWHRSRVTTRLLHMHPDPRDLERVGQPTVPHVARVSAELDARHA